MAEVQPASRAALHRTADELGGERLRMTIDGRVYDKRSEAARAWQQWARVHTWARPSVNGDRDLGVAVSIGGHDIRSGALCLAMATMVVIDPRAWLPPNLGY